MYKLSNLFRFSPKKCRAKLPKGCLWMRKHKHIEKCLSNLFKLFFKKQCFKKSHHNTTGGGGGSGEGGCPVDPNPHFLGSGPRETGKLNQTDRDKGLPKCGIYIGVTPCRKLGNMKKQQKHTDWVL